MENNNINDLFTDEENQVINQQDEVVQSQPELPYVEVRVSLSSNVVQIPIINLATSKKEYIAATKELKLRLSQGRGYYIPVDTLIDSDKYWDTKVFSDISGMLSIQFVKNGHAYVVPFQHNILLEDKQLLCLYWNHV